MVAAVVCCGCGFAFIGSNTAASVLWSGTTCFGFVVVEVVLLVRDCRFRKRLSERIVDVGGGVDCDGDGIPPVRVDFVIGLVSSSSSCGSGSFVLLLVF